MCCLCGWPYGCCVSTLITKNWVIIIIIIIIIISFMQGIYTYIPETNYVPRVYTAAILLLLFMVLISLVSVLNLLYFYISTFRSMCAVPNMAVFCSSCSYYYYYFMLVQSLKLSFSQACQCGTLQWPWRHRKASLSRSTWRNFNFHITKCLINYLCVWWLLLVCIICDLFIVLGYLCLYSVLFVTGRLVAHSARY